MVLQIAWMTTDNEGKFKQGLAPCLQKYFISEPLHNLACISKKNLKKVQEYLPYVVLETIDYNTIS